MLFICVDSATLPFCTSHAFVYFGAFWAFSPMCRHFGFVLLIVFLVKHTAVNYESGRSQARTATHSSVLQQRSVCLVFVVCTYEYTSFLVPGIPVPGIYVHEKHFYPLSAGVVRILLSPQQKCSYSNSKYQVCIVVCPRKRTREQFS